MFLYNKLQEYHKRKVKYKLINKCKWYTQCEYINIKKFKIRIYERINFSCVKKKNKIKKAARETECHLFSVESFTIWEYYTSIRNYASKAAIPVKTRVRTRDALRFIKARKARTALFRHERENSVSYRLAVLVSEVILLY